MKKMSWLGKISERDMSKKSRPRAKFKLKPSLSETVKTK